MTRPSKPVDERGQLAWSGVISGRAAVRKAWLWSIVFVGCASIPRAPDAPGPDSARTGVLVMAHGGSDDWNETVKAAVAPLRDELPVEIAFGMADPETLQEAVDRLEAAGVNRMAVVRLFVSGSSFLHATQYLFGERPDAPDVSAAGRGSAERRPIDITSRVSIDPEGLVDASEAVTILRERAERLSRDPGREVVLLLGHGNEDESTNDHLLERMSIVAEAIHALGVTEVEAATLREDWVEARADAEREIREWVASRSAAGFRVLVIPFRLSGFGPYADVLSGLPYEADGLGLLPHAAITAWLRRRAQTVFCQNGWSDQRYACPALAGTGR